MIDTSIEFPAGETTNKEINDLRGKKFIEDSYDDMFRYLTIEYDNMIYKPGYIPCKYTYAMDNEDVDFLLSCVASKCGLDCDIKAALRFAIYMKDGNDRELNDQENKFKYISNFWDNAILSETAVFDMVKKYCFKKAQKEFPLVFEYWVSADERDDYLSYEKI